MRQARAVLVDTLGVLHAASSRTAVNIALSALEPRGGVCTVIGHDVSAPAETAAFINGIGGHDIELDDLHSASRTHPASVIVPAVIATAERHGGASCGDLLAAIVAGYDVEVRLSKALGPIGQYEQGWHPSAVTGAVGAAVAAGRGLGIGADRMTYAIGLAASQSSGLLSYYDDPFHMAKSFQTGVAARNGVVAALCARAGYTSAPDALTGDHNIVTSFGGRDAQPAELLAGLGVRYEIVSTTIKRHACCALSHAAVDALLELLDSNHIDNDDIERIEVELPHDAKASVDGNRLWTHNIQYTLALGAHQKSVGLEHFSEPWTTHPDISDLAALVDVRGSDALQRAFPEKNGATVRITTRDGSFACTLDAPHGSPGHPFSDEDLYDKFIAITRRTLAPERAWALWDAVMNAAPDESAGAILRSLPRVNTETGAA